MISGEKFLLHKHKQSRAFSAIEALVAIALLSIIVVAGGFQVKSAIVSIEAMRRGQTIDALEHNLYRLLSRNDVVTTSIERSGDTSLIACNNGKNCQSKTYDNIAMYIPGTNQAFTGRNIYYDKAGQSSVNSPCSSKSSSSCRSQVYRVITKVTTQCIGSTTCAYAAGITVGFFIEDGNGKKITEGEVNRIQKGSSLLAAMNIGCDADAIMQGVGLDGLPLCVSKHRIVYADDENSSIKPFDCRTQKDPSKDSGDSQQYFVQMIKDNGDVVCSQSFWNK